MRALGFAFVASLALGACTKKQPPKAPPPPAETTPAPDAQPPATTPMERKGDPCEGGEKPK